MVSRDPDFNGQTPSTSAGGRPARTRGRAGGRDVGQKQQADASAFGFPSAGQEETSGRLSLHSGQGRRQKASGENGYVTGGSGRFHGEDGFPGTAFSSARNRRERDREGRPMLDHMKARTPELWQTWQRLDRLGQDLRTLLPRVQLIPIKLEQQVLLVTAPSSALAARLRQYEPRLVDGLQARGWLVNRVKFRPNTVVMPEAPPPREKEVVPSRAVDAMAALGASAGITPELRAAIERFVARQRGYQRGG